MKKEEVKEQVKEEVKKVEEFNFDTFQINSIEDVHTWNKHARRAFIEAKKNNPKCDPPVHCKSPGAQYHKIVKVKFNRMDQPENVLKVKLRNAEIEWEGQLKPGFVYELPLPVVRYLNKLSVPIFAEVKVEDGGTTKTETQQVGERNRFSCHLLEVI